MPRRTFSDPTPSSHRPLLPKAPMAALKVMSPGSTLRPCISESCVSTAAQRPALSYALITTLMVTTSSRTRSFCADRHNCNAERQRVRLSHKVADVPKVTMLVSTALCSISDTNCRAVPHHKEPSAAAPLAWRLPVPRAPSAQLKSTLSSSIPARRACANSAIAFSGWPPSWQDVIVAVHAARSGSTRFASRASKVSKVAAHRSPRWHAMSPALHRITSKREPARSASPRSSNANFH
mmetsp:Transcript_27746/g.76773  ORF Transcript_27746/g.76773 Transcript_27746/m.76773 type:complete len:237 (-) Transcript_27746:107-817(-)